MTMGTIVQFLTYGLVLQGAFASEAEEASACTPASCEEEATILAMREEGLETSTKDHLKMLQTKTAAITTETNLENEPVCPDVYVGTPKETYISAPTSEEYEEALKNLDVEAVKKDVEELMTSSHECWPADFGNYGPFFVRLAWHCSGTYRHTDGAGGCSGGRQRFDPEASWDDNTNLDKARALLAPIKRKHGIGLSWGDLFVIAGTQSMRKMGTPLKNFCWGRVDNPDGYKSLPLGPSDMQKDLAPCTGANGDCQKDAEKTNLATTTLGLIYVNPEGPMGKPVPEMSAQDIRKTFCKMGKMTHGQCDEKLVVALIGGGHAFGKTHGACSDKTYLHPAGYPPNEALKKGVAPWMGRCPKGEYGSTWTSGFEGAWTTTPTKWSNEYFQYLVEKEWEKFVGPGGHWQWRVKGSTGIGDVMRLTSDIALTKDSSFNAIVKEYASNLTSLDYHFDKAWFHLTHNGGTWASNSRCEDGNPPPKSVPATATMLTSDVQAHE